MMKSLLAWCGRFFSPGAFIILGVAIITSVIAVLLPTREVTGLPMWTSARSHFESYEPLLREWNRSHLPGEHFDIQLLSADALSRRMLAGFLSGTPTADILEVEHAIAARAFLGPLKDVGLVDLTSRIRSEGLYTELNTPSFSPYTTRGHIFGLPHDVHPVLLAYRADLVEAAGIDVSKIETWADYFRAMRPLMADRNHDGQPDHYPLNSGVSRVETIQILLRQGGGTFFDDQDRPWLNNSRNAQILAQIVAWCSGPDPVCVEVNYGATGYQQIQQGLAIGYLMPDWLAGVWKLEDPRIGGKLKLMPLPAWQPGGLRTSVLGGTMIGIARTSRHVDLCWQFIKYLYLSPRMAEHLFRVTDIISPVKAIWQEPFYNEPDPFFSGQPTGRLYIEQAPFVPARSSSPYMGNALTAVIGVAINLQAYAEQHRQFDPAALTPEAQRLLDQAQARIQRLIQRNQFLAPGA